MAQSGTVIILDPVDRGHTWKIDEPTLPTFIPNDTLDWQSW